MTKIRKKEVAFTKAIICPFCQTTIYKSPYESKGQEYDKYAKCDHLLFIIDTVGFDINFDTKEADKAEKDFEDPNGCYFEYRSGRFNSHIGLGNEERVGTPKDFDISPFSSLESLTDKVAISGTVKFQRGETCVGFAPEESLILVIDSLMQQSLHPKKDKQGAKEDTKKVAKKLEEWGKIYSFFEEQLKEEILMGDGKNELPPFCIDQLKDEDIPVFNRKQIAKLSEQTISDIGSKNSWIRMKLDPLWDLWENEAKVRGLNIAKPTRPVLVKACKVFDRLYESSIIFVENGPDPGGLHGETVFCLERQFEDRNKYVEALRSAYAKASHYDPSYGRQKKDQFAELASVISNAASIGEIKLALKYTAKIPEEMDLRSKSYAKIVRAITYSSPTVSDLEKTALSVIKKITNPLCKSYAQNYLVIHFLKKKQIGKALALERSGKFYSLAVIVYYLSKNQHKKAWDRIVGFEKSTQVSLKSTEVLNCLGINSFPYYRIAPWVV